DTQVTPLLPVTPLFPYTTLFRSSSVNHTASLSLSTYASTSGKVNTALFSALSGIRSPVGDRTAISGSSPFMLTAVGRKLVVDTRSEEHTSELQSRFDHVCRLLLE